MAVDRDTYFKVREKVGLFDASYSYGRLFARGKDVIDLLHRMSTQDLTPLEQAKGSALTFLTNEKGRIVDLLKVVRDSKGETLLIVSAGKEEEVIQWLDKFTIMEDVRFERATEKIAQFELMGTSATSMLGLGTDKEPSDFEVGGYPARAFQESDGRVTVLADSANSEPVWNMLKEKVLDMGGDVIDEQLFEVLRVENGIPFAPHELNEKHNPLETPLASEAVSFTKGCYIGQEVIARLDAQQKVQRQLMGLRFEGGIPATDDRIIDPAIPESAPLGNEIGEVTSVAESPKFGTIGLGYVRGKYANPGTKLSVKGNTGNIFPATLVTLPFND